MITEKKNLIQRIKEDKIAAAEKSIVNITNESGLSTIIKFLMTHWVTVLIVVGFLVTAGVIRYQQQKLEEYKTQITLNELEEDLEKFRISTEELEKEKEKLKEGIEYRDRRIRQLQKEAEKFTPQEKADYIRSQIKRLKEKRGLEEEYTFTEALELIPLPKIPKILDDE